MYLLHKENYTLISKDPTAKMQQYSPPQVNKELTLQWSKSKNM